MGKRIGMAFGKDKGQSASAGPEADDDPNKPPGRCTNFAKSFSFYEFASLCIFNTFNSVHCSLVFLKCTVLRFGNLCNISAFFTNFTLRTSQTLHFELEW